MAEKLVPLPAIEKLSSRVIRVLAGNPGKVSACVLGHCLFGRKSR